MSKHQEIIAYLEELPVGKRVSVRSISNYLGVSEGTAYRAIKEAENRGLVETRPRSGTIRVKSPKVELEHLTFKEIAEITRSEVLAGQDGLEKEFSKFSIGAMTEKNLLRYLTEGGLLIIGDRTRIQLLALKHENAVLVTGGLATLSVGQEVDNKPQPTAQQVSTASTTINDEALDDVKEEEMPAAAPNAKGESLSFNQSLKQKFIEGNAGFMSLVAIALVLGLAFCIERIIYLSLSEIDAKRFMANLDERIAQNDIEGAKELSRNTRGPVASICYQGLLRINSSIDDIERSVAAYGSVQSANLEKGCSWITLFIAMAPSLGFLGTVIGMVMAFDQIQMAGDISPTIVASGMKVALITTIFGIIVALVLMVFYNYILSKIEHLTAQMEESAITLLDSIMKYKLKNKA